LAPALLLMQAERLGAGGDSLRYFRHGGLRSRRRGWARRVYRSYLFII